MYPIMIITLLAGTYMAMMRPNIGSVDPSTDAPSRTIQNGTAAAADAYGADLALFASGIQNMVTRVMSSPEGQIDIIEELTANGGQWVIDWAGLEAFFDGNGTQYRQTLVNPAVPASDVLRASFFQPGYTPSGPWRALIVQRVVAGVGVNEINAVVVYADTADPTFLRSGNIGAMIGGMARTMKNSALIGVVGEDPDRALISRGYVGNYTLNAGTQLWDSSGVGGSSIRGIPAVIPVGAPVSIRCMRANAVDTAVASPAITVFCR
jgi:hypothetical protein